MAHQFNVIVEESGKFVPYDIMPYLKREWSDFLKRRKKFKNPDEDKYYRIPTNFEEFKSWVDSRLQYQYWARCEYEIVISQWVNPRNVPGKKVDVYWQCQMNMDLITKLFIDDLKKV